MNTGNSPQSDTPIFSFINRTMKLIPSILPCCKPKAPFVTYCLVSTSLSTPYSSTQAFQFSRRQQPTVLPPDNVQTATATPIHHSRPIKTTPQHHNNFPDNQQIRHIIPNAPPMSSWTIGSTPGSLKIHSFP